MDLESWAGSIDLSTRAAQLLDRLAAVLPQNQEFTITVFGSAPIQIRVDASLTSADVDVFSDAEELREIVDRAGLGQDRAEFYIQVSSELNFRTSPRWKGRTRSARIGNSTFVFPHPIDILTAKLNRLDDKDVRAFRAVLAKTGHPTEAELIKELQFAVDLFRPSRQPGCKSDRKSLSCQLIQFMSEAKTNSPCEAHPNRSVLRTRSLQSSAFSARSRWPLPSLGSGIFQLR